MSRKIWAPLFLLVLTGFLIQAFAQFNPEEIAEREADGSPRRRKKLVLSGDPFFGGPKEAETTFYFPL